MPSRPHIARLFVSTLAAGWALQVTPLRAQMHKVAAPERVTRAVGVYEYTGTLDHPTAARLVPVSLFIDGQLQDAGVYLSRPVPFALQPGVQYAVETAGEPVGTFNVDASANNLAVGIGAAAAADVSSNASDQDATWYGVGRFAPPPTAAELAARQKKLKVSARPAPIVGSVSGTTDDDRPSFVRRQQPAGPPDPATTASSKPPIDADKTGADKTGADKTDADKTDDPNDPNDRPTLRRRDDSGQAIGQAGDQPDSKKKPKRQKPAGYVTGPEVSLNDDPDRPTLHRGTPSEDGSTPVLRGLPADLHQVAAVSDNASRDAHPFAYSFESLHERTATLDALEALARPRIAAYLADNHLTPVAATVAGPAPQAAPAPATASDPAASDSVHTAGDPAAPNEADHKLITRTTSQPAPAPAPHPATPAVVAKPGARTRRHAAAPAAAIALTDEQLHAYELTYGGVPTFVYTVQVPVASSGPVYLTLIAQRLATGELQPALTSVTDASHLDRTPWLRPVDVVDPDAAHRGNLILELRGRSTRAFALYRLVTAHAEQTFVTGPLQ